MSKRVKKNFMNMEEHDVYMLLSSAVSTGNLKLVETFINSHGLSREEWHGGYELLCNAIKLGFIKIAKFLLEKDAKVQCKTNRPDTPLHAACLQNSVELVRLLLVKEIPVNIRNNLNETPLHIAAKEGYTDIVEVLLSNQASVTARTKQNLTPLFLAVEGRHKDVVQMLLRHSRSDVRTSGQGNEALLKQILLCTRSICAKVNEIVFSIVTHDEGESKIVNDLIDHGFVLSHVNKSILLAAIRKHYVTLIESILSNNSNLKYAKFSNLLLHAAIYEGRVELVKLFLNAGFDANSTDEKGKTCLHNALVRCGKKGVNVDPVEVFRLLLATNAVIKEASELLHVAVRACSIEACQLLIQNGANVNARNELGETPLYNSCCRTFDRICKEKQDEIANLLFTHGANVNIKTVEGHTALHNAVSDGRNELVQIFLDSGVDVDLRDGNGLTPLHLALKHGFPSTVQLLCRNKANVNARDPYGWTPLHLASFSGFSESVKTLLNFGASVDARGPDNETVLHCAHPHHDNVIEILIHNGCDVNVETTHGATALDTITSRPDILSCTNAQKVFQEFLPNWRNSDRHMHSMASGALRRHLFQLKAAGLFVSKKNLLLLYCKRSDFSWYDRDAFYHPDGFEKECEVEINKLKNQKLSSQFSLLEILTDTVKFTYARNPSLMKILKSYDWKKFRIYKKLIMNNLKNGALRPKLLNAGQESLGTLLKFSNKSNGRGHSMPPELLELIVLHLNNHDLKSLMSSVESLKRQLCERSDV